MPNQFSRKNTSCACLVGSGLKGIFHSKAHSGLFHSKNSPLNLKDCLEYPLIQIYIVNPYAKLYQKLLKYLKTLP